jgi:hypothetical protein
MFLRPHYTTLEGWKARVISEPFVDDNSGCIYFWFQTGSVILFIIHNFIISI